MADDPPIHPYEKLTTPEGEQVDIDRELVSVVRGLWRLGFATTTCCQDVGEATAGVRAQRATPLGYDGDGFIAYHLGYALLKMPVFDAGRLVEMLVRNEVFSERIRCPWSPGSWRMNIPLTPEGPAIEAFLHFPRAQIAVLADVLREEACALT